MVQRHSFQLSVLHFIRRHRMISPGDHLVAGVSGGPDSMALLHILKTLESDLEIESLRAAHFEHGLRGAESLEDQDFVQRFCAEMGVECRVGSEDVNGVAREMRISWEMAARICRHRFFRSLCPGPVGTEKIALAHTANDQAEEVLLRLCRGTGPSGLGGMRPREASGIVRPLLFAPRAKILEYLNARGLAYRTDSSNQAPVCQRNRIRLEVLPALENIMNPGIVGCIERHTQLARDEEEYWESVVSEQWGQVCLEEKEGALRLKRSRILELHPAVTRRILRHALKRLRGHLLGITARHIESLCALVREGVSGSTMHLPSSLRARLQSRALIVTVEVGNRAAALARPEPRRIDGPGVWTWGERVFKLEILETSGRVLPLDFAGLQGHRALLDVEAIRWPLCLRTWLPGDRFQPLGLPGHKKLQDFFVDLKVPREQRQSVPILCDGEKICWVVGYRLDDRVKCTPGACRVLLIDVLGAGSAE